MGPLVTVIVPVYGVEEYLPSCIESILKQSYRDLQILLVDDGSPDGCGEICERYARQDGRVHAIHRPNGGVSSARNSGLAAAQGELVCFVDGDDLVRPDMVRQAVRALESGPYDLCMWGVTVQEGETFRYSGRRRDREFLFPDETEKARFLCRWFLPSRLGWGVWQGIYRRPVLEKYRLQFGDAVFGEDMDFVFRYLLHSESLQVLARPLYIYRVRPTSATYTIRPERQMEQLVHIVAGQRKELSRTVPLGKFYLYEMVFLARYVEGMEAGSLPERAERFLELLKGCPEWGLLQEDAGRLLADRSALRLCAPAYGGLVRAVCRLLAEESTGQFQRDAALYRGRVGLRTARDRMRAWKEKKRL